MSPLDFLSLMVHLTLDRLITFLSPFLFIFRIPYIQNKCNIGLSTYFLSDRLFLHVGSSIHLYEYLYLEKSLSLAKCFASCFYLPIFSLKLPNTTLIVHYKVSSFLLHFKYPSQEPASLSSSHVIFSSINI